MISGAWQALTLWDHLTYSLDLPALYLHLLPVFSGIASFFTNYMHIHTAYVTTNGNNVTPVSVYLTGPTTSPENSYGIKGGGNGGGSFALLEFYLLL